MSVGWSESEREREKVTLTEMEIRRSMKIRSVLQKPSLGWQHSWRRSHECTKLKFPPKLSGIDSGGSTAMLC